MKAMSLSNLYSKTGCLPKCAQTKYKFNPKKSTPINWRSSSISSFYLTAESDQVEEQVEYLVYDMQVHAWHICKNTQSHQRLNIKEADKFLNKNHVYMAFWLCSANNSMELNCRTYGAMLVAIWDSFLAGSHP